MRTILKSSQKKVTKNLLARQVYDVLFDLIVRDELKPGEKLNIEGVSQQLNVSRSPVAAAFSALEHNGFLIILPQNGTFVRELTRNEMEAIYLTRAALERVVATFAVKNVDVKELYYYKKRFESYLNVEVLNEGNMFSLLEVEMKMHNYLSTFIPDIVRREYENICNLTRRSRLLNLQHELKHSDLGQMIEHNVGIHIQIIGAFVDKDLGRAIELLEWDVLYTKDSVLSQIE
jgi:DNA-binding GntR family transcriptional regulator